MTQKRAKKLNRENSAESWTLQLKSNKGKMNKILGTCQSNIHKK